ncbi:MAG: tRNA (adenosine(37)-N6)-dimethylallyltransferase MiaA [Pseudomonadota bacterium]
MPRGKKKTVAFIAGPTAGGKSALALALARRLDGVVINADSMQVYADLRVLTARPGAAEEAGAPHELYGVIDGAEAFSAARWARLARAAIDDALAQGKLPILVGGTGLYFRALEQGLSPIPEIPAAVKAQARALWAQQGEAGVAARLTRLDPVAAARIAPGDRQRMLRALEVALATGTPLSTWQQKPGEGLAARADLEIRRLVLAPARATLYQRIDARVGAMLDNGAVEEVRRLMARRLEPDLPVMKALGVKELSAMDAGALDQTEAVSLLQRNTRRYAKRQLTWLRHQCVDWHWQDEKFIIREIEKIFS